MSELRVNAFWKFNAGQETAANALHGEPRKVRGAPQRAGTVTRKFVYRE
jgi:hypothetical protein